MCKTVVGIALAAVGAAVIVSYFLPMWTLILIAGLLLIIAGAVILFFGK